MSRPAARRGPGRPPIGVVERVDVRLDADSEAGAKLVARQLGAGVAAAGVRVLLAAYADSPAVRAAVREHIDRVG
jgi:phosphomannomutase